MRRTAASTSFVMLPPVRFQSASFKTMRSLIASFTCIINYTKSCYTPFIHIYYGTVADLSCQGKAPTSFSCYLPQCAAVSKNVFSCVLLHPKSFRLTGQN